MIEIHLSQKQIGKQQHYGENMKANSYAQEKLRFLQNRLVSLFQAGPWPKACYKGKQ